MTKKMKKTFGELNEKYYIYWILAIITTLIVSIVIILNLNTTEEKTLVGTYTIAITSTLGILLTITESKKDIKKQMMQNDKNLWIQTEYKPMREALIKLDTYFEDILNEYRATNNVFKLKNSFRSSMHESFFSYLPSKIRNRIEENTKYFIMDTLELLAIGYILDEKFKDWGINDPTFDLNVLNKKDIELTSENSGIFFFFRLERNKCSKLHINHPHSDYEKILKFIRNISENPTKDEIKQAQKELLDYKAENSKSMGPYTAEITNRIQDLQEEITLNNMKQLITEDIREFNQNY